MSAWRGRWSGRLAALVLGAPLALAFPRPGLWWLAFVGLAPLLLLAAAAHDRREAAVRAWLGGTGFFLAVNLFLAPKVGPFMVPLALLLGALWLPLGWLAWRLLGRPTVGRLAAALALLPSVLVVGEAVRSWEGFGGPWGLLGASQWNHPPTLAVAALGGVWAVSFLLAAVNVAVAAAARPGGPVTVRAAAAATAVVLPLAALAWWAWRPAPPPAGTVRVALVQPGVISPVEARFQASERLSLALRQGSGGPVDLVVWGESSVGRDPAAHPGDLARLAAVARAAGGPVLANVDAQRGRDGGIYKTALLVGPSGVLGSYDKMRLVPFGEYVPLRPLLGWVTRFTDAAKVDRHRGRRLAVLPAGGLPPRRRPDRGPDRRHHLPAQLGSRPARQPGGGAGGGGRPPGGPGRHQRGLGRLRRPRPPAGVAPDLLARRRRGRAAGLPRADPLRPRRRPAPSGLRRRPGGRRRHRRPAPPHRRVNLRQRRSHITKTTGSLRRSGLTSGNVRPSLGGRVAVAVPATLR